MDTTCKNPDSTKTFIPKRAGPQYCSVACRVAVHRKRHAPLPSTFWIGNARPNAGTGHVMGASG
jgi:hypothetical protein